METTADAHEEDEYFNNPFTDGEGKTMIIRPPPNFFQVDPHLTTVDSKGNVLISLSQSNASSIVFHVHPLQPHVILNKWYIHRCAPTHVYLLSEDKIGVCLNTILLKFFITCVFFQVMWQTTMPTFSVFSSYTPFFPTHELPIDKTVFSRMASDPTSCLVKNHKDDTLAVFSGRSVVFTSSIQHAAPSSPTAVMRNEFGVERVLMKDYGPKITITDSIDIPLPIRAGSVIQSSMLCMSDTDFLLILETKNDDGGPSSLFMYRLSQTKDAQLLLHTRAPWEKHDDKTTRTNTLRAAFDASRCVLFMTQGRCTKQPSIWQYAFAKDSNNKLTKTNIDLSPDTCIHALHCYNEHLYVFSDTIDHTTHLLQSRVQAFRV
jgi:hypothetical protein